MTQGIFTGLPLLGCGVILVLSLVFGRYLEELDEEAENPADKRGKG